MVDNVAKDWLSLALAGLGITFLPHDWIGGMFLALAGAAFAMRTDPEQDRRELWVVLLGAFLVSHLAALAWQALPEGAWPAEIPVQVVMAVAGFMSRRLTRLAMKAAGMLETRTDKVLDRVIDRVLPDDDKEDGK